MWCEQGCEQGCEAFLHSKIHQTQGKNSVKKYNSLNTISITSVADLIQNDGLFQSLSEDCYRLREG